MLPRFADHPRMGVITNVSGASFRGQFVKNGVLSGRGCSETSPHGGSQPAFVEAGDELASLLGRDSVGVELGVPGNNGLP